MSDVAGPKMRTRVGSLPQSGASVRTTVIDPAGNVAQAAAGVMVVAGWLRRETPLRRDRGAVQDPLGGRRLGNGVSDALRRRAGSGEALPDSLADGLGSHFGQDLSSLRVHRDTEAGGIADALQSQAFTHGNDVYFAPGRFRPATEDGQRLIAHELAHVVAQRTGVDSGGGPGLTVGWADDPAEAAADRAADGAMIALRRTAAAGATRKKLPDGPRPVAPALRSSLAGPVRRWENGYNELDIALPNSPAQLGPDDAQKLREIKKWLDRNDTHFDWLGLYDLDQPAAEWNRLAERIGWANTHVPEWLAANQAPEQEEWNSLSAIHTDGEEWLNDHRDSPFASIKPVTTRSEALGLGWIVKDLTDRRESIEKLIANGKRGDGHQKKANLRMRSLTKLAESLDPILTSWLETSGRFHRLRLGVGHVLDLIDQSMADKRFESVNGADKFRDRAALLRKNWRSATLVLNRPPQPSPVGEDGTQTRIKPRAAGADPAQDLHQLITDSEMTIASLDVDQRQAAELRREVVTGMNYQSVPEKAQSSKKSTTKPTDGVTRDGDIVVRGTPSVKEVANQFPTQISNAAAVASDIINNPEEGKTGFTVRGKIVFHSSARSSTGNSTGTAFWIMDGKEARVLVAMGRHAGKGSDTYTISWVAPGVKGKDVRLNSKNREYMLTD